MESTIIGYRSIANRNRVIISGHAYEKYKVIDALPHHGRRRNLKQTIRRFHAKPLKWTAVEISVNGTFHKVRTNKEGYFTCELDHQLTEPGWYPYELFLKRNNKRFRGEFHLIDEHNTGVISDIDDTVLISHSTRMFRKLKLLLFRNAHTRKPIPLIRKMYAHLLELNHAEEPRDFFYVSNSEWNLYDFLYDFFKVNELPKGIFFLQNLKRGIKDLMGSGKNNHNHKLSSIDFLLRFYPNKLFILVGDNGQQDMDIYYDIASRNPERIKGVIIRKVHYLKREKRMSFYKERFGHLDIPFITFPRA